MKSAVRRKILEICELKISQKGPTVGLSFYAFFKNKNDDPDTLFETAQWWIITHKLDHFEKETKIKSMIEANL